MDFAYSPHREGGGTLHLHLSPTHRHGYSLDPQSSLQLIRRSLSRSPSKPSRFHSPRWVDSSSLPISPLANSRAFSPKSQHSEARLFTDNLIPQPKKRFPMRRPTALRSSPRNRNPSKSPRRRALADSTDQGNGTAPPSNLWLGSEDENTMGRRAGTGLFGLENAATTEPRSSSRLFEDKPIKFDITSSRQDPPTPGAPMKSTSLKRTDEIMNFPAADVGTPIAKRRSVHGVSVLGETETNVFDRANTSQTPAAEPSVLKLDFNVASPSPFSLSPGPAHTPLRKSTSLRRTTVSQRQAANTPQPRTDGGFAIPLKHRMSFDGGFSGGNQTPLRRPSVADAPRAPFQHSLFRPAASTHQPHPLSNALSPSFSTPGKDDEDTEMGPPAPPPAAPPRNPGFSKSLPIGTARPFVLESATAPSFETPSAFKMAKPNPSAFMSTGLLTKKNRLVDETSIQKYVMPGTPSKRASFPPVTASPSANRRSIFGSKIQRPEFGQPSTPFSLHKQSSSASFGKGVNIFGSTNNKSLRRSSFASLDGDESFAFPFGEINPDSPFAKHMSDSQSSHDDSMPPTPTKQSDHASSRRKDSSLRRHAFGRARSSLGADTFAEPESFDTPSIEFEDSALEDASPVRTASPQTPCEAFAPPDPSMLSISGQRRGSLPFNTSRNSEMLPPATPTTPRDHSSSFFKSSGFNVAPITGLTDNDVDQSLVDRFDSFSLWGDGEFSKVYRAEKQSDRNAGFPSSPMTRVFAVKKTKKPYAGPSDREKKMKEVHILKALRGHEHIVSYEDHWEHQGHLYIQTEFCEEGNLARFLAQAGNKGRLDSFRIWKILLEMASGLSYIHDSGYIHLDLKPANILITFDGVLKIADFGLATPWPVVKDIDGEGDRHYLAPEAMMGRYDKPCDIFALGVIMCEIACNVEMPENGTSWQKLRSGDFSELPSLTFSSESTLDRDVNGDPIYPDGEDNQIDDLFSSTHEEDISKVIMPAVRYNGGLATPPNFMVDDNDPESLHQIVQCMMNPMPSQRPTVQQVLGCYGCQWVQGRSRAGATIFEGNWGPADDVLNHKTDYVDDGDRMDTD